MQAWEDVPPESFSIDCSGLSGSCNTDKAGECVMAAHKAFPKAIESLDGDKCDDVIATLIHCVGDDCADHECITDLKVDILVITTDHGVINNTLDTAFDDCADHESITDLKVEHPDILFLRGRSDTRHLRTRVACLRIV